MAKLASLPVSFENDSMIKRYPKINWSVTAGNSSQITDGAFAALITDEDTAVRLNLKPRAAITHFAVCGSDPILMLTGVIPATQKLLQRSGLSLDKIDAFEINEAFASVVMRFQAETGVPWEKINVNGGAIAMGHPLGATGAVIANTVLDELERRQLKYGLCTLCVGGGMVIATILERI